MVFKVKIENFSITMVRYVEFLSLFMTIVGIPLLFLYLAIFIWLNLLAKNQIFGILGIVISLGISISWNTHYGIGGVAFLKPFKNYLHHGESNDDVKIARLSFLFVFALILIISLIP